MKQHPTTEALLAYPMGELEPETARSVFEHCNSCPECGAELAMIITLRATVVASERPDARTWPWLAVAASVLLLIAIGVAVANLGVGFLPMRPWTSTVGDEPPGPGPGAEVAPRQADYASLATRETLPQAHVDFRYGLATPAAANQRLIRQGVQAIVDERFDDAERILRRLHEERPSDAEISVHLGVAMYLQGDLSDVTETLLRDAPPTASLGRTGHWYLGNLLLARGDVQRARSVLESLVGADDRWGRRAQELLRAIDRA